MSVAWVAVGASVVGGLAQADSARSAANKQQDATNRATDATTAANQQALELQKPIYEAGNVGRNRLLELLGLGSDPSASGYGSLNTPFKFDSSNLATDPSYLFQREQGQNALDRKASAAGGFYSGQGLQAASAFNQNLASTTFNDAYNRQFNEFQTNRANTLNPLQALAGQGQSAANTAGQTITGGANALAGLITNNANAQGASQIAQGNALAGGINNGLAAWQRAQYLNQPVSSYGGSSWGTPGLNNFFYGNGTSGD